MKLYQRFIRIYYCDPFNDHVHCTDWMPEDEGMEFYKKCENIKPDDEGQGYYEGYWKDYHYEECFRQVEKQGEWIHSFYSEDDKDIYKCSECGRFITLDKSEDLSNYPYCHCGALMSTLKVNNE